MWEHYGLMIELWIRSHFSDISLLDNVMSQDVAECGLKMCTCLSRSASGNTFPPVGW